MIKYEARDWPWWTFAVVLGLVGAAAMAAGCQDDGARGDRNQRWLHGPDYVITAGPDAGAAMLPGSPDTPPGPRSGSGG